MRRHYLLSLVLCLLICLAATNAAFGETQNSAKQLFLTNMNNSSIFSTGIPYQISSGTSIFKIKKIATNLPESEEFKQLLVNTRLKCDSKIDNLANKMEVNYTLTFDQKDYTGSLFLDSDKMILSTEIMDLYKDLEIPSSNSSTLPRYIYFTWPANAQVMDEMGQAEITTALQEMLMFIFEAIPEHYYQLSAGDKIKLQIDHNGLPEIIRSLTLKALTERERFTDLVLNLIKTLAPSENPEDVKLDIQEALEDLKELVDTPESPGLMLDMLGDSLTFNFVLETSLLPAGSDKCLFELGFKDSGISADIHIESNTKGSKENLRGTGIISFKLSDEEGFSFGGKVNQDFHLNNYECSYDSIIDIGVSEKNGYSDEYLLFTLTGTERFKPEKSVTINIPELTPENSKNLTEAGNKPETYHEQVQVVLDGETLSFDTDPFIKEGRTVVPIRNLAEELGYIVIWVEPNQVVISDGDTTISMFLGQQTYTVNGIQRHLDIAPFENGGSTFVPVRFIAGELGCMVYYSEASNTVYLNHRASPFAIPNI